MKVDIHNHDRAYDYEFNVKDSGIVGVYGISGSGKSSLLDALAGYDESVKGSIEFKGTQLNGVSTCAYMNQHPILFDHWTIKQNLDFVKDYHKINYDKYLKALNCSDLLNKFPSQLSGGEKQRIAFIRALIQIHEGSLVLLDEPFSALDKTMRKVALGLLLQHKKALIFLVTHEVDELYHVADEFLYVKDGIIENQDTIINTMKSGFGDLPIASKITLEKSEHIIYADDVSISLEKNKHSSIQHQLDCTIKSINNSQKSSLLELSIHNSEQTLYAHITLDSLNRLALSVNKRIIANFKALAYHD